ncbi:MULTISPECIES: pyridoxal-phosphate dependent enzyme [Acinetobacter]|uniref:1-aminocyclopropane-1-carboxylate deaminase/D-cysteine desulfhydrase n=1 Tax=Acinetobacter TaxID=469 RepID=UPI00144416E4|nr:MULTISPECIES: pyridoxal-phosphate dependent enzyme [Acinetobacter]
MFDAIAQEIPLQRIYVHGRELWIKRLDLVHPHISGNKFYKLKYNFLAAQAEGYQQVLTFGGAYSNHIAATAYTAQLFGWKSIGIIRGQELANCALNPTLNLAQHMGMQFEFVSRERYRQKNEAEFLQQLQQSYPHTYIIPEGGSNRLAIQGCQEILTADDLHQFDVICCAVGTGGTIAGLIEASLPNQKILGFSALKGDFLTQEVQQRTSKKNWQITDEFCCGGYAKTTPELLAFIRAFEKEHAIPLEQIYTGKMLFGLSSMIQRGEFNAGERILLIHTGGLQGRHIDLPDLNQTAE